MSKTVDERVVSMKFDNQQFEKGVSTSIHTIDSLKEKLKFNDAGKSFDNLNAAAKRCDMSALGNGIETVKAKFSALEVMGMTALVNITNSAVNTGKKIVSALTIDPVKTGFQEYETQINAVQTILANTQSKGTTLDQVNKALDTLNTYADKTIYNFTEMTRNIGTFTAAGVDLDTSVNAIQGIANLAATSGSTSQQASTAMYQLSQALSSGTVKLQDWNSVVNAGMGGQVFQDALKETAKVHGIAIDDMIEEEGSFRETLKNGWLTSDILTETLQHFTEFTDEYNEKTLKAQGYTDKQIESIKKLGITGTEAATKVKTFTQLFDTLKEAAQSGWTQSWELIVGDFEEAKTLLTEISDTFGEVINKSAESRNAMLTEWKDLGGRQDLIDSFWNVYKAIGSIIKPIKEAFSEIFPPTTGKQLKSITEHIKNFTSKLIISDETAKKIKSTLKGVFSVLKVGVTAIKTVVGGIGKLIGNFKGLGGGILDITSSIGDWLHNTSEAIIKNDFLGKSIDKVVGFISKAIDKIKEFGSIIKDKFDGNLFKGSSFEGFTKVLGAIWIGLKKIGSVVGKVGSTIGKALATAFKNGNLKGVIDLVNGGIFTTVLLGLKKWIGTFKDFGGEAKGFIGSIKDVFGSVGDSLEAWQSKIKFDNIKKIAISLAILAGALWVLSSIEPEKLSSALSAISIVLFELIGAMKALDKLGGKNKGAGKTATMMIGMSVAVLILAGAVKKLSDIGVEGLAKGIIAIGFILTEIAGFSKLIQLAKPQKMISTAIAMVIIAASMEIFANVTKKFGDMSWEALGKAGAAIGGILLLATGFGMLSRFTKKMVSASIALIFIGAAIEIFANVAKKFGSMEWEALSKAGVAIGGILVLAAGFGMLSRFTKKMITASVALVIIGAAMEIFANVCNKFGSMEWEALGKAGAAIAGILVLAAGFGMLSRFTKKIITASVALVIIGSAIEIFANVAKKFGEMEWEALSKAGAAIAGILVLAAGFTLLSGLSSGILASSAALLVMAVALNALVPVITTLGGMPWGEIIKGLVTIAGVFVIFGIAGYALGPVVPVILALSRAIALFGVGCLAVGAGVMLLSAGIATLATVTAAGATAIVAALSIIIMGILELIPSIINVLTETVVAICQVFIQSVPALGEALRVTVLEVMKVLVECTPEIVNGLLTVITQVLTALVEYMPQITDKLIDLFIIFLNGLTERLPEMITYIVNFLVELLNAVSENIEPILSAISNLISSIIQGIANIIGPLIQNVLGPILDLLKNIIIGIVEAIAPYIPSICEAVERVTQIICDAAVRIMEIIAPFIPDIANIVESVTTAIGYICDAFNTLVSNIAPIIDSITELIKQLGDTICDIFESVSDTISTTGDAISEVLNSVGDTMDTVFTGIGNVITDIGDSIKSVLDGIADVISAIGEAALNAGTGFENLAKGVKIITELNLLDMGASLAAVAVGVGDIASHSKGLKAVGEGMSQLKDGINASSVSLKRMSTYIGTMLVSFSTFGLTAKTATTSLVTSITTAVKTMQIKSVQFSIIGRNMMTMFSRGIIIGSKLASSAIMKVVSTLSSSAKQGYSSMNSAGKYLGDGLISGINAMKQAVYNACYALGQKAVQGEKDGQKSKSPSKLTEQSGIWLGEGLIIGIDKMSKTVYKSGYDLGKTATGSLSKAISKISEVIDSDMDTQPTIRPVLDLSDISAGANSISGMFDMTPSVGVMSNISSISSMMNSRQNGNNDDIISAIKDLSSSLGSNSGTSYTINGITYDDGTNVSNAVKDLVRAVRIERRK